MRSRTLIICCLLPLGIIAQTHRIDSIRYETSRQSGKTLVDSYNELGTEFYFYWLHTDSGFKYTDLAFHTASSIDYVEGKIKSLLTRAGIYGRLLSNLKEMERTAKMALNLVEKVSDAKLHSMAWYYLGVALTIQGKYKDAALHFEKARNFAEKSKDKFSIGWAQQGLGFMHFKSGTYWKSFPFLIEAQRIGKEINDSVLTSLSLAIIARTFNEAGDPQSALNYYHEAFRYGVPFIRMWSHQEDMAYAHLQLKNYDSAAYYQALNNREREASTTDPRISKKFSHYSVGYSLSIQLAKGEYDSLLIKALTTIDSLKNTNDVIPYTQAIYVAARTYEGKGNYKKALEYTRMLHYVASGFRNRRLLRDAKSLFASVFEKLGNYDSAYYYHKQYIALKDSMETLQFTGRTFLYLAASEAQNKIRLLEKDKEIGLQQLVINRKELQKQSAVKNLLVAGLIIMLVIFFLVFRNILLKRKHDKLKYEHEQTALKQRALELEMQALRAQMNPHFIFNCLNAIDNLIQTNQAEKATTCLARFAKLIRAVLDSSKNNLVPFQKDLDTLKLYLEMEQFRCNNKFLYELKVDDDLLEGDFKIPPMIIQPFIENAIHHGLLNKEASDRLLKINAELKDDHIVYSISDNGIGRKSAAIIKENNRPGQLSYGIQITRERIQLHNKNGIDEDLKITDLEENGVAKGTRAVVRINCVQ